MSKKDRLSGRLEPRRSRAAAPSEEVRSRGAEEMQEATIESLRLCQQARSVRELMQLLRGYFQRLTGCEAVGVRLRDGDDFPYYETRGFPPEFVRAENRLRAVDQAGEVVRDSSGNPVLECMCGNILCGRYDPSKPFFTAHGSFWSNCTTELLAGATETDRQARTRNRCNGEGYESVALLPLRGGGETFGLFQFNDRRKGLFTAERIAELEGLIDYVALAFGRLQAEAEVRKLNAELEQGVRDRTAELVASEERYRLATRATRDTIYDWDIAGDRVRFSEPLVRFLGELGGSPEQWWSEHLHAGDRQAVLSARSRVLSGTGDRWEAEYRLRRFDGGYVHVFDRGLIVRDHRGHAIRMVGAMADITERKQARDALQESRDLLQTVIDGTPDIVVAKDREGCYTLLNASGRAAGLAPEGAMGKTEYDLLPPEPAQRLRASDLRVLETGESIVLEETLTVRGRPRTFLLTTSPRRGAGGEIVGVVCIAHDMTDLRRAEEDLRRAERLASIGRLAAGVAHEINNPIGMILITAENALAAGDGANAEGINRRALQSIIEDAERCGEIVKSLLQFAREEPTLKWPNDLNRIVEQSVATMRKYAEEHEAVVDAVPGRGVPEILANPLEMGQVCMTLIQHAVSTGPRGVHVTIRTERAPEGARLVVEDDGRGLSEEDRQHAFDPFYVAGPAEKGPGLGLSIVHGIVEGHRGTIEVESVPGAGTTIRVQLPFAQTEAQEEANVEGPDR